MVLLNYLFGWLAGLPNGPSGLHLVVLHQVLHIEVLVAAQHTAARHEQVFRRLRFDSLFEPTCTGSSYSGRRGQRDIA
jgi:hypothetical protein